MNIKELHDTLQTYDEMLGRLKDTMKQASDLGLINLDGTIVPREQTMFTEGEYEVTLQQQKEQFGILEGQANLIMNELDRLGEIEI